MNIGDKLHGFTVLRTQRLSEPDAELYELSYDKNGARLLWLDRDDDNMTFGIGFKTPPRDDTGVFHIIEHSVLCGSDKYPVKDPFVILLKSSLQTFLNALTFADKTVYPVCSRNRQDFLNLMDVYLDAVLHPLSAKDPHAFLQEGWHFELTDDGRLTRNGVVYNEMKGSFANSDTVLYNTLERSLFPDTCYGHVSGGDPAYIPELTYENYLANYRRCYHPSNAYIFLDGRIDTDAVLSKISSFLCEYDAAQTDTEIPVQTPVCPPQTVAYYEIDASEEKLDRVLLSGGYVYGTYDSIEEQYACEILAELLTGTNDAPLKKALLEKGLCEDVEFDNCYDIRQPFVSLTLRNTTEEKAAACWQTVEQTLKKLVADGLDHEQILAALNHLEFVQREKDSGRTPIGLVFGINAMEEWLHGGDPVRKLELGDTFAALRRKTDEGWFETLVQRIFLDNPHCAKVMLLPDAALGQKKQAQEEEMLAALQASWSDEQLRQVRDGFAKLRERQQAPDSPAQLATLPKLSLQDIPEQYPYTPADESALAGHRLICMEKNTAGISYLTLHFSLRDLTLDELSAADFLTGLLGELATEHYTPTELNTVLQASLGHFSCDLNLYSPGDRAVCDPYLEVSVAVLEESKAKAVELLQEVLLRSRFDDTQYIFNLLRQDALSAEQHMISAGHAAALQHAYASLSAMGAAGDATSGIGMLRWLQKTRAAFEDGAQIVCDTLAALCRRIFVKERITVSAIGAPDRAWAEAAVSAFPAGDVCDAAQYTLTDRTPTGYQIPAQIGFAAKVFDLGTDAPGAAKVASKILALDYLWNEVRVKGGAYGASFGVRMNGMCQFSTYRDPNPAGALAVFGTAGDALRAFCDSDAQPDDYIISSVSDLEPLLSPRAEGQRSIRNALSSVSPQQLQRFYSEVLHTDKNELREFAALLDEKQAEGVVHVVGGAGTLDACGELLARREQLQAVPARA